MYRRISGGSKKWLCRLVIFWKGGGGGQLPFFTALWGGRLAAPVRSIAGAPPARGDCAKMAAGPGFPFRSRDCHGNVSFRKTLSNIALRPVVIRNKGVAWDLLFPE